MTAIGFHSFALPNLNLQAAIAGPDDGPLVILLHGFPQCWYQWRHQIPPLAEAGFRVVAPDQRGYNLSDKTPPYDLGTLVQDIEHLIAAAGRDSAHIIGHDWGAAVAWGLAATRPERVRTLAILNVPHPGPMGRALFGGNVRQMLASWYIAFFQLKWLPEWMLRRDHYAALRSGLQRSARRGAISDADLEVYARAWAQPGALTAMLGWYRGLRGMFAVDERQRWLKRIAAPTVILWGERVFALRVELAEESVYWLEQGRLVRLPGATHWVAEDLPESITQHLLAHLRA